MNTTKFKEGDLVSCSNTEGICVAKILRVDKIDTAEGPFFTYHMRMFEPVAALTVDELDTLQVQMMHVPIDPHDIDKNWTYLKSSQVESHELEGFLQYLRMTDFGRFLKETGQDPDEVIQKANSYYREGCMLSDANKHEEAIDQYSKAIELFPLFFEAIDNRGFSKMDLGRFEEAFYDFQESIQVDSHNPTAIFSAGECLLKLGRPRDALPYFEECVNRWPQKELYQKFLKVANELITRQNN